MFFLAGSYIFGIVKGKVKAMKELITPESWEEHSVIRISRAQQNESVFDGEPRWYHEKSSLEKSSATKNSFLWTIFLVITNSHHAR